MKNSPLTIQNGLSQEYRRYKKDIDRAILRVLNGGRYVLGKELERFEERFADLVGTRYAVGVGNGFDALYISLVCTKPNSFWRKPSAYIDNPLHVSPTNACKLSGYKIIENPSKANTIITTISPGVRDWSPWYKAVYPKVTVIEDACQSVGMKREITPSVTTSCYSFHPLKVLHCYGDGGAIATNNCGLYDEMRTFRNHGRVGKTKIYFTGVNSRLDEIQAAVLNVMMDKLKGQI